ncbi:MAG: AAA family ATPase [Anaeromyxobacter sp.]
MGAYEDILKFSKNREAWQLDLIRRLATQPTLGAQDLDDVLEILKAAHGHGAGTVVAVPISAEHVNEGHVRFTATTLVSVGDPLNTNRLAPDQTLPLAERGLTVVYGENGSGKSGYSRILKQACRAKREAPERILSDVYAAAPQGPAEATIKFTVDGAVREHRWRDGEVSPSALSRITVFDAATAPLYADRQNEIEYLPNGLDIPPRLGKACEVLAGRLGQEADTLKKRVSKPVLDLGGPGPQADAIALLVGQTPGSKLPSIEHLTDLAAWSPEDDTRVAEISRALASDPRDAATRASRIAASLRQVLKRLDDARRALSEDGIRGPFQVAAQARAARIAAEIAAKGAFDADPLGAHVGSGPWRELFDSARRFSLTAYPEAEFPATGDDKVCVLCQQLLSPAAAERLRRFAAFVEQDTHSVAAGREEELTQALGTLRAIAIPNNHELRGVLGEFAAASEGASLLASQVEAFGDALRALHAKTVAALASAGEPPRSQLDGAPLAALEAAALELEVDATRRMAEADTPEHMKRMREELAALQARRVYRDNFQAVRTRRDELAALHVLNTCIASCNTRAISQLNSSLREKYLTQEVSARIESEIKRFGLDYLPFRIGARSDKGASFFGPELKKESPARTSTVLSEGEFRALALACFFADIGGTPGQDAIVLDDPVSSLDHRFTRRAAQRIVAEAGTGRQVVVFTHSLSFYFELLSEAARTATPLAQHCVRQAAGGKFGLVHVNDSPWQAKKVKDRLHSAGLRLAEARKVPTTDSEAYRTAVREFYTELRETWERLIEEALFNNVIGRYKPGISTQSLRGVQVTDDDYRAVHFGMTKVSEYSGHDWAQAREGAFPSAEEMARDLTELRAYWDKLTDSVKACEKHRRSLESAPTAPLPA